MSETMKPKGGLWSDFDGTIVRHYSWKNPRNWTKYPVEGMPGFQAFLMGASGAGLEPEAIVSRRPDILPRREATHRSIAGLGMTGRFPEVVLTGSEEEKAAVLARRAFETGKPKLVMLEDKPHNLVPLLADALDELGGDPARDMDLHRPQVVVGAVKTSKAKEYMAQTLEQLIERSLDVSTNINLVTGTSAHLALSDRFSLKIIGLHTYSEEAGVQFASHV